MSPQSHVPGFVVPPNASDRETAVTRWRVGDTFTVDVDMLWFNKNMRKLKDVVLSVEFLSTTLEGATLVSFRDTEGRRYTLSLSHINPTRETARAYRHRSATPVTEPAMCFADFWRRHDKARFVHQWYESVKWNKKAPLFTSVPIIGVRGRDSDDGYALITVELPNSEQKEVSWMYLEPLPT